jgi:hypothetical protein
MKETKLNTKYGAVINFESTAYCPRCHGVIPTNQLACIGCLPEGKAQRERVKRNKVKPDQGGLFDAVPGVKLDPVRRAEPLFTSSGTRTAKPRLTRLMA